MSTSSTTPLVGVEKHFTSTILLWMRSDRPREAGMAHWKGPHSGIISATPGLAEYRQIHLAAVNPGHWPAIEGVETSIPEDRRVDGVAEVTFQSALAPLKGRAQTKLAYEDEVNVFRRTLLYAGPPNTSRWYQVAAPGETVGSRAIVYLRRKQGVSGHAFHKVLNDQLAPSLASSGLFKELRTQQFLPWVEKTWDTPDVAHDNPREHRLHASVILGFVDAEARAEFFRGDQIHQWSQMLTPVVSAIHAYDISETLTFVRNGEILPHYEV